MERGKVREVIYASRRRRVIQFYGGSEEILGGEDKRVRGIEAEETVKIFAEPTAPEPREHERQQYYMRNLRTNQYRTLTTQLYSESARVSCPAVRPMSRHAECMANE
jgi:hypothetical protein